MEEFKQGFPDQNIQHKAHERAIATKVVGRTLQREAAELKIPLDGPKKKKKKSTFSRKI